MTNLLSTINPANSFSQFVLCLVIVMISMFVVMNFKTVTKLLLLYIKLLLSLIKMLFNKVIYSTLSFIVNRLSGLLKSSEKRFKKRFEKNMNNYFKIIDSDKFTTMIYELIVSTHSLLEEYYIDKAFLCSLTFGNGFTVLIGFEDNSISKDITPEEYFNKYRYIKIFYWEKKVFELLLDENRNFKKNNSSFCRDVITKDMYRDLSLLVKSYRTTPYQLHWYKHAEE